MKRHPTLNLPLILASAFALVAGTASAQTPKPLDPSNGKPVELYQLTFNEEKNAFVDPATQEPYTGAIEVTYVNGTPETTGQLKNGLEEGYWTEYTEKGIKTSEGEYQAGDEIGPWFYYWDDGKIQSEGIYKGGTMEGIWKDYFANGKISTEGTYVDGKAQGPWQVVDESTDETQTVYYKDGEEVAPPGTASDSPATPGSKPNASPAADTAPASATSPTPASSPTAEASPAP